MASKQELIDYFSDKVERFEVKREFKTIQYVVDTINDEEVLLVGEENPKKVIWLEWGDFEPENCEYDLEKGLFSFSWEGVHTFTMQCYLKEGNQIVFDKDYEFKVDYEKQFREGLSHDRSFVRIKAYSRDLRSKYEDIYKVGVLTESLVQFVSLKDGHTCTIPWECFSKAKDYLILNFGTSYLIPTEHFAYFEVSNSSDRREN